MGESGQYISVVGQPVAYGIGLAVLALVAFSGGFAASLVTVAHEGGHMAMGLLTGAGVTSFSLTDKPGRMEGETELTRPINLSVSNVFISFAGYAMPPLLGLGGAHVVADGNSWGVLWIGVVLLGAVLLTKANPLATAVTGLALAGVLWAAVAGDTMIQASVATGLVWLMLIGGFWDTIVYGANSGDAADLSKITWIPRTVWAALWFALAVACLWSGGRLLLAV